MTTSTASVIVAASAAVTVGGLVVLLLRHFVALRSTPAYLLVPVFLAVALPASLILLVPIDLASSLDDGAYDTAAVRLPPRLRLVAWRITYWLCFVLTWFGPPPT